MKTYKPLFQWFGAKARVASVVWTRLGDVDHYVEPFFGSGAVYFLAPKKHKKATINDVDCYIVNFFRTLKNEPFRLAKEVMYCSVAQAEMRARHYELTAKRSLITSKIQGDPEYYNLKYAAWWVYTLSAWIAGHFTENKGVWTSINGFWCFDDKGIGEYHVYNQAPQLTSRNGIVKYFNESYIENVIDIYKMMLDYRDMLVPARIICSDWKDAVRDAILRNDKSVGIFLDPPYDQRLLEEALYIKHGTVSSEVRDWAVENGNKYRIALCGYEGEHEMPPDWEVYAWTATGGYSNMGGRNTNRFRERIWFSPQCIKVKEIGDGKFDF